jgi:hypothetical protein
MPRLRLPQVMLLKPADVISFMVVSLRGVSSALFDGLAGIGGVIDRALWRDL